MAHDARDGLDAVERGPVMNVTGQPPTPPPLTCSTALSTPSALTTLLSDYLRVRRALGFKLEGTEILLTQFLAYLHEHVADTITIEHALRFATAPAGASSRWHALRLSAIRCFTRWAAASDPRIQVPPRRLLTAAHQLHPAIRAATIHTLIALMASTGTRTGEALALDLTSLDLAAGTLLVTGKYGKTRLLPLHPTVRAGLLGYLDTRAQLLPAGACPALLIPSTGRRLPPSTVHPAFRAVVHDAGIDPGSGACRPRLHDLRHTFAVTTMLDAYRSGANPATVLQILSTWLGHADPADTYWYLTGTSELLAAAADRLAHHPTPAGTAGTSGPTEPARREGSR